MKLYFRENDIKKKPNEKILTFIKRIFESYAFKTTYTDVECVNIQCVSGKNRSIDDLLLIIKTYYPKSKDEAIYKAFRSFLEKNNKNKIHFIFCPDISKWVCFRCSSKMDKNYRYIWNYKDSINKRNKKGKGKETYNSFMNKLGYKEEELKR